MASLRHLLAPASVAVFGASRRPGSVGRAVLWNITTGGFPGPVYAVNPGASELDGVRCVPSAAALPAPVDLAVVAAPAYAVLGIAEECGQRGVRALAVITSGLDGGVLAELLGICRRHGMRLVGPASFGVASTSVSLDATFAAGHPRPGTAGLALQSGGVGVVLLKHLSRLGVGISSFVSLGDKDDVSGNDMLLWWESDAATKLAVLYLVSFGNPRKFAPGLFRRCLEVAGADPGVDAILALTVPTATSDLVPELCAARLEVTIVAAVLDDVEAVRLLPGPGEGSPAVPAYAYPESAARALGHAVRYGMWRALPPGRVPDLEGVRQGRATELVTGFLASTPDGGWLPLEATVELLGCYGIPLADSIAVTTEDTAVAAAVRFSGPVTLRADVPGLLRTTGAGAVPPGLQSKDDIRPDRRADRDDPARIRRAEGAGGRT